jgi:hypothetical protein
MQCPCETERMGHSPAPLLQNAVARKPQITGVPKDGPAPSKHCSESLTHSISWRSRPALRGLVRTEATVLRRPVVVALRSVEKRAKSRGENISQKPTRDVISVK